MTSCESWRGLQFQSTLSRGERLLYVIHLHQPPSISIHALTRRAAIVHRCFKKGTFISIHALTRRAARPAFIPRHKYIYFNPRSHEESGIVLCSWHGIVGNFNPRSHEESGIHNTYKLSDGITFQSTLSRGERLICIVPRQIAR